MIEQLYALIDETRNVKDVTIRAYISKIQRLYGKLHGEGNDFENLDFLKKHEQVDDLIKDLRITTQRNYYSAIIVCLIAVGVEYKEDVEYYRDTLEALTQLHQDEMALNKKNEKQSNNWSTLAELKKVMNDYKKDLADRGVFSNATITKLQYELLKKWVVTNLFLHDTNPPVRAKDYGIMKIIKADDYALLSDETKDENNYLVIYSKEKKVFYFADYKTKGAYGILEIKVGKVLNSVLNIYLHFHENEAFFVDTRGMPMSANKFTQLVYEAFAPSGKHITITLLRHIYITEKFPSKDQKKKELTAARMGHSIVQQYEYAKDN
mgnify:CR=1 FL=1